MQLRGAARAWRLCGQERRSTHHAVDFLVCPRPANLGRKTSGCVGSGYCSRRPPHAGDGHPLTDSVLTEPVETDWRTPDLAILTVPRWRTGAIAAPEPLAFGFWLFRRRRVYHGTLVEADRRTGRSGAGPLLNTLLKTPPPRRGCRFSASKVW